MVAAATKAVYEASPALLLFVEGPDSADPGPEICVPSGTIPEDKDALSLIKDACAEKMDAVAFKANWGENFKPLLDASAAKKGVAKMGEQLRTELAKVTDDKHQPLLTEAMINWLLGRPGHPDGAHIVFSPHLYGEFVATWQSSAQTSPYRFNWNFGFLQEAGYPVVVGENGFKLDKIKDVDFFQQSLAPWMLSHKLNHNLFYWTFNSNSGDTDGLRADANTAALVIEKEKLLHDLYEDKT